MSQKQHLFDIEVEHTLRKTVCDISVPAEDIEAYGDIDTSSVDWASKYAAQHYGIMFLLARLQYYLNIEIDACPEGAEKNRLKRMLEDAKGWSTVDFNAELCK